MKINMGDWDRIIRVAIAAVLLMLMYGAVIPGTLTIVLGVVTVIFFITGMVGVCPLYSLLGVSTCPRKSSNS